MDPFLKRVIESLFGHPQAKAIAKKWFSQKEKGNMGLIPANRYILIRFLMIQACSLSLDKVIPIQTYVPAKMFLVITDVD